MTDVFRERVESPLEPEIAPQAPKPFEETPVPSGEVKAQESATADEKQIEIWEGLNRRKYISEYFNIKAFEGEFNLKMQTSQIDKYIRGEIEKNGFEKSIGNYEKVLRELEAEIGSDRLETFKRISRLTGYIAALNRLNKAKETKERYLNSIQI
jgi:hypothetical protein